MGDAAGSGPEIITKSLADPTVRAVCRPVVVGDAATMREALRITGVPGEVRVVGRIAEALFSENVIEVIDLQNIQLDRLTRGQVNPMAGKAAFEYIKLATRLALDGECDAIVTSAINKEALNLAGYHYDGHTQLLAELCQATDVAMMLASDKLRISHVTTHVSLEKAIKLVRPERIMTVIRLTDAAVRQMGIPEPRIAVAGLNPHSGEGGLFGDEETKYILPAIEEARRQGINITGPLPPDSVFFRTLQGQFDAAIAQYHDQGHIAIKMLGITEAVNITLGLPIIRTSVDHGTNFGKAGKGTADPTSLTLAIKLASVMCRNRKQTNR
ncbi:MAG: 4-hydroxythreonine-4-phosphate dehydrogenase PdxA [Chloroflexi bacterium]|nr:4-hydroxythreonine-4-phosphate dehydrogenase PdxA [Chloroflexota bacterium]